ncbi:MAG: hypothetical protein JST91_15750 [Actinobacteria bacterium]|nr:hypothetical protein [Actinomycetota bacterium]
MTTTAGAAPLTWLYSLHPAYRLILRWGYIAVLTVVAFRATIRSVVESTLAGSLIGYVLVVPVAAALAAVGVARRHRTELPIHDRQTDMIVGVMGQVLALLLHAVLLQRYALYYYLLRLDLVALWVFVLSASILLFGLRPVIRFAWVWALLSMVFPLPYYIIVILLGGTAFAAGTGTIVVAGVAVGIAVGRVPRRGVIGSAIVWVVGIVVLALMAHYLPDAPLIVYQAVPALMAICLVGTGMFLHVRRGEPKRLLNRQVEPLAAKQVWAALPVVLVVAVALSFVRLPDPGFTPTRYVDGLRLNGAQQAPPGWHSATIDEYTWVSRLFGADATLVRQKMVADTGDPRFDKFARPRTLVVDTTTTHRPFSFNVYPARVLYRVEGIRLSALRPVDLGYGVEADLFSAVDDRLLVTWDALQWKWSNGDTAQRMLVIAVDNHEDDAPFPQPTGGMLPTLNSMFTVLFRGNSATDDADPNTKDDQLLVEFGRALVRSELEPLGVRP